VVTYLIGKGIVSQRLVAKGYGETKPVAGNTTEEGRAKNRRTELKVISQ
jgi:outer membrane protein OmpA-like peptidoglycan-associated protein